MPERALVLHHRWALGDTVLLSALVRDIHRAYPGRFSLHVDTAYREIWENNPYCRPLSDGLPSGPATHLTISYAKGMTASNQPGARIHMLAWYHYDFCRQTGLDVPVTLPKGDLHLTPAELDPLVAGRYWLIVAGGKFDISCKHFPPNKWQAIIHGLRDRGITVVQAGARAKNHYQPTLSGVVDWTGRTASARQFFNLIYHADGVICPVTGAMHIAACFDRPCVVLAGGREPPIWEAYGPTAAWGPKCAEVKTQHHFLHTIGMLDCCRTAACWKHRVVPLGNKDRYDGPKARCKLPVIQNNFATPKCLDMIQPEMVLNAVDAYYKNGDIPPIGEPKPAPAFKAQPPPIVKPLTPVAPVSVQVTQTISGSSRPEFIDHPLIGGRLTVLVLCYGPHPELARRCLGSLLATVPASCLDLRVTAAAVVPETLAYLKTLPLTKLYVDDANSGKYRWAMTRMLSDPECPITTPYLLWLDDDTNCINPNWASDLCRTIVGHPEAGMFGRLFIHDARSVVRNGADPLAWFRQASWWRGRPLQVKGRGTPAANGTAFPFVVGWAWGAKVKALLDAGIPDQRLNHNGGDILAGLACLQAGISLQSWNEQKQHITCPSRENGGRRGKSEPLPWAT